MIALQTTAAILLLLIGVCQTKYTEDSSCIYIHDLEDSNNLEDGSQTAKLFELFQKKFNKEYPLDKEYHQRLEVFKENLKKIKVLQERELGTAVYGVTAFADLTEDEFKQKYLGLRLDSSCTPSLAEPEIGNLSMEELPEEFDYRDHNAVTPIKDQGHCGSCWAFAVTANIESAWAIRHKELMNLSPQELLDCDKNDDGCHGGDPCTAYRAVMSLGGLETMEDYPYQTHEMKCAFNKTKVKATISGFVQIPPDEEKMAKWLYLRGPMTIALNSIGLPSLVCKGVLHPSKDYCDPDYLNHAVVIVGYGVEKSPKTNEDVPYWIIKNSWGTGVGEKGYYRIYRGDGTCGLNRYVLSAVVDTPAKTNFFF